MEGMYEFPGFYGNDPHMSTVVLFPLETALV
jgi:hypothetical protein